MNKLQWHLFENRLFGGYVAAAFETSNLLLTSLGHSFYYEFLNLVMQFTTAYAFLPPDSSDLRGLFFPKRSEKEQASHLIQMNPLKVFPLEPTAKCACTGNESIQPGLEASTMSLPTHNGLLICLGSLTHAKKTMTMFHNG